MVELIVGGDNEEKEEEEDEEKENDDFDANIPVQTSCMLCSIDRDEFITFQKMILKNGDVGYVSMRDDFYRCNICSKHHHGEDSKDAHADYCK